MSKRAIFLTAALLCAGTTTMAQNAAAPAKPASQPATAQPEIRPLGLGDKAPTLKLAKFVKGDPITGFEKGKTYVVEFWATWCGPCKASIPHLTELQKEYKGKVTFLGVSVWESDQSKVEPFVTTEMGDKMVYTVAMDEVPALPDGVKPGTREAQSFAYNNGAMSKSWMQAAGQGGIPSAFIVNGEGRIAWIGHPMNIEEPLAQVTAGTWDIEKAKADAEAAKKAEAEQAQKMAGINKGMQEFNAALKAKDYAKVSATGAALMNDPNANEQVMNFIAWSIVDPDGGVEKKDLDLAMKAATKGCELSGWKDGMVIDTLARVYFVKGDLSKAVELQTKAVANSEGDMKAQIEGTLKEYQDALAKQRH